VANWRERGLTAMIRLAGITKSFSGKDGPVAALDGIDLSIARGEIFGIIGSSGAGKSTLVRLINLLERPTSGEVFVAGERVTDARGERLRELRRSIGMVFQHFNLLSARTVAGNVAYPLELTGQFGKIEIAERVAALLARVGLAEHAHKYPASFPAARSSVSASPGRLPASRRCCSATRRRARSIRRRRAPCSTCCARSTTISA
jgi:D-methionine transport system ATP-binding protein